MVRALLDGTKTQTRRAVKSQADSIEPHDGYPGEWLPWKDGERQASILCPYGIVGDRLWVRETWAWSPLASMGPSPDHKQFLVYAADDSAVGYEFPARPSIHMFRWASRIILKIADVRVERLQDISDEDVLAEGTPGMVCGRYQCARCNGHGRNHTWPTGCPHCNGTGDNASVRYAALWDSINGEGSWDANPWVWCLTFNRIRS